VEEHVDEKRMCELCDQLLAVMRQYPGRSNEVRTFILAHRHEGIFERLALALLLLMEGLDPD
jgi:hypothetical protein